MKKNKVFLMLALCFISVNLFAVGDTVKIEASWSYEPNVTNNYFGTAMCFADVNGDGLADAIISSDGYSNGQTSEGAIFVFHSNGTNLPATPTTIIESNTSSTNLGKNLCNAGDVNNDGYEDVLVKSNWSNVESNEGKLWLFFGSSTGLNSTPVWTREGNQFSFDLGRSIYGGFDYNNDGYDDMITANSKINGSGDYEGTVQLFQGGVTGYSASPVWSIIRTTIDFNHTAEFGAADLNNDGYVDLVMYDTDNSAYSNGVEIFWGSASGYNIFSDLNANSFGKLYSAPSFDVSGDVNNDGINDLIISSQSDINSPVSTGKIDIYYGPITSFEFANDSILGPYSNSGFGETIVYTDFNGDGLDDIVSLTHYALASGYVFLYESTADGFLAYPSYENSNYNFGLSSENVILGGGDIDGDGDEEILIGNRGYDNPTTNEGTALLFNGAPNLSPRPIVEIAYKTDDVFNYSFGKALSTNGDFNNDGLTDILVGAPSGSNPSSEEGQVFLFYGSVSDPLGTYDWKMESNQAGAKFGSSVSNAGDFNNDGYDDVLIGAPNYTYTSFQGAAFVYKGGPANVSNYPNWVYTGDLLNYENGYSVSAAGDLNGDSFDDIIIGSPSTNAAIGGPSSAAKVFNGSATWPDAVIDVTLFNDLISGFGAAVTGVGDVTGDGYNDVMVTQAQFIPHHESRVFLYTGSATGVSNIPFWTYAPPIGVADFGNAVDISGDINNDGINDIVIGSPNYSNGSTAEGIVYVFYGGVEIAATPDWTFEQNMANTNLGTDLACGDLNNDGFDDLIVGVPGYSVRELNRGLIHFFYGSASGLGNSPDFTRYYLFLGGYFGRSLSYSKDINGNGIGEIAVGFYQTGGVGAGAVHIYEGFANNCNIETDTSFSIKTDTTIEIGWIGSPDALSYDVRWKITGTLEFTTINTIDTTLLIEGLSACSIYTIEIIPVCEDGSSESLVVEVTTTGCPETCSLVEIPFVNVDDITANSATVSWGEPEEAISYYFRYKPVSAGSWIEFPIPFNSILLTTLITCTDYEVQIKSDCGADTSFWSASTYFSTTCLTPCATAPTGVDASNITPTSAKISWTAAFGAIKYKVYYRLAAGGPWTKINATSTSKNITGLTPSTNYQYKVLTVCSGGVESPFSPIQTFTTLPLKLEDEFNQTLLIYPSPNTGNFDVTLGNFNEPPKIVIYDALGQIVFETQSESTNACSINMVNVEPGIYFLEAKTDSKRIYQSFLIQK